MTGDEPRIHFGWFVRWWREEVRGMRVKEFAAAAGLDERTVLLIETHETPRSHGATLGKLSAAMGLAPGELQEKWQTTPVPPPRRRVTRRPEEVTLRLPREHYDSIARMAARHKVSVEEWIVAAAGEQTIGVSRPLPSRERPSGEASRSQRSGGASPATSRS